MEELAYAKQPQEVSETMALLEALDQLISETQAQPRSADVPMFKGVVHRAEHVGFTHKSLI